MSKLITNNIKKTCLLLSVYSVLRHGIKQFACIKSYSFTLHNGTSVR